jgi:hypothetical protein
VKLPEMTGGKKVLPLYVAGATETFDATGTAWPFGLTSVILTVDGEPAPPSAASSFANVDNHQ